MVKQGTHRGQESCHLERLIIRDMPQFSLSRALVRMEPDEGRRPGLWGPGRWDRGRCTRLWASGAESLAGLSIGAAEAVAKGQETRGQGWMSGETQDRG